MGYMMVYAPCFVCRHPFGSNPRTVPSHQGQPVCKGCMEIINDRRVANGMDPFPIPPDAYEATEE
jgi:hypothetical protein